MARETNRSEILRVITDLESRAWILVLALLFLGLPATDAHAYLDPGTGSYVLQLLIAGVVGAVFALKTFWRSILSFVARLTGRKNSD